MYFKFLFLSILIVVCTNAISQNVLEEKTYITDKGVITVDDDYVNIFDSIQFYPWNFSISINEVENSYIESYNDRDTNIMVVIIFDDLRKPEYITITIDGAEKEYYIIKH